MTHADAAARHRELVTAIRKHDHAYYVLAQPAISDHEYDRLYRELVDLEAKFSDLVTPDSPTQRVGGEPLKEFRSHRHALPMMSLDNTYSEAEVHEFVQRVQKALPRESLDWIVEPKVDGVAVSLTYEDGRLAVGATRGDGTVGDEITSNLRTVRGIPLQLSADDQTAGAVPPLMEVRGEVFMTRSGFHKLNAEREAAGEEVFANARNATAGSLKQLDSRIVARRPLRMVVYGVGHMNGTPIPTHGETLEWLRRLGFNTPQKTWICTSNDQLFAAIHELDSIRKKFDYETDGAVVKLNRIALRQRVGSTAKAPRWAIAYKYKPEQAQTRVKAISIQVGRTGALTPVAELEPVFLSGSTIARATLHNEEELRRRDIRVGDMVIIEKAGEVIPAVIAVVTASRTGNEQPFPFPRVCPECGSRAARDAGPGGEGAVWRCVNPD
jgi:DNA ligase (NAD+)